MYFYIATYGIISDKEIIMQYKIYKYYIDYQGGNRL
jgi:hypothetical protein